MKMASKLRLLFTLDKTTFLFHLEAFLLLGWARTLLFYKFSKIAPSLGERGQETDQDHDANHTPSMRHIASSINTVSKYTPWDSKCLVRAIAGMKMLERRGIGSTLYLGTAKDNNGKLIAHAWLRSGPYYISGAEVMDQFTIVDKFAKTASQ
ncbi:Transglutaminase-like superfamily protein [Paenibacillus sophorae]|uniref:Lasso peptide biosynthesis B2 protein n=1 Tax=Paenibacillus sophorae TaxID=1333845 RepID=A0A1H8RP56_9BACL|nr:lasso peptide biosynthesis B2 protein [Paenibacillus sophorae]QWU17053.1 lasso peptide biosynthesis B2 protein [Paenibacillus sophorae]SEO67733.1 Transglutaminase-like superfamily protein [Paenibacillus sophorae]